MDNSVTVVIPTYNRPKLVIRAINSVINQDFQGKVFCIIVDNSTNLDTENTITIACVGASDNFQVVVQPEQSFALGTVDSFMLGETDTSPHFSGFENLSSIQINPGSNTVDVEVFVASV